MGLGSTWIETIQPDLAEDLAKTGTGLSRVQLFDNLKSFFSELNFVKKSHAVQPSL